MNESFIVLKIVKSAIIAPRPPISPAKRMLLGWAASKKPMLKGAENPKVIKAPAIKIPK